MAKDREVYEDEYEEDEYEEDKKKKGHGGCFVVLGLLIVVLVAGLVVATMALKDLKGTAAEGDEPVTVSIAQGSGSATVAQALQDAGVIRYPQLFRQYLKYTGKGGELQYGDFQVVPGSGYDTIIEALSAYVKAETVSVTIPEGTTAQYIASKMEEAGLCTAADFMDAAENGDYSQYRWWNERTTNENVVFKSEGYLFPSTYEFLVDDTAYNYVATFYAQLDKIWTDEMYARADQLGMSFTEVMTLASFVQEEAGNDESANVSAVFHNRLAADSPVKMLQSNTCSYVQNDHDNNYLWNWIAPYYGGWDNIPANVYEAYDTYQMEGLPAGPISNPGYDSIYAALYPTENFPNYYFVTDVNGNYYYAETYGKHLSNCDYAFAQTKQ